MPRNAPKTLIEVYLVLIYVGTMIRWLRKLANSRALVSPVTQAEVDFAAACPLLELNEILTGVGRGIDGKQVDKKKVIWRGEESKWEDTFIALENKWKASKLSEAIAFANDSVTIQLSEMFQHVSEMDGGDLASPLLSPLLPAPLLAPVKGEDRIGPSTHTNPAPTMHFAVKEHFDRSTAAASIEFKRKLGARHGFSLWVGPSQLTSQALPATGTPQQALPADNENASSSAALQPVERKDRQGEGPRLPLAGVYIKGRVAPGTVVALYPGAVYNSEMLCKAVDMGALGGPRVPRQLIPRFDDAIIDASAALPTLKTNPYALAHYVRHPPASIQPNVMRLQYDFLATPAETGADAGMPFPAHLRDYIPNVWGSDVTVGQQLYGMLEQDIWVKGMVLIALRPLWDEELFVDVRLPPGYKAPSWYTPIDKEKNTRTWARITG